MLAPQGHTPSDVERDTDPPLKEILGLKKHTWLSMVTLTLIISSVVNIILMITLHVRTQTQLSPVLAEEVVVDQVITFDVGFDNKPTIYEQSPSQDVDDAWAELFRFALSSVPAQATMYLPNRTFPIPGQPDRTVISLSVLHQIHCLDVARRAMRPEHYHDMATDTEKIHTRHCLSELRQSLMCSADISPIVWQWSEHARAPKERADIAHSCRDFERIREWSRDHAFRGIARKVG